MPLPIQDLCDLVHRHACTVEESASGAYTIEVNDAVWRATGALKSTATSQQDAFEHATFFCEGLITAAGAEPAYRRAVGALAEPREIGDAVVWRGTFNVAFPRR